MFLLTAAKAVVMVGLVGRLISLQINQATKYKSLSDKNRFREWKLAPERGVIKDFFDQELASNEPLYQVHLVPENTQNINQLFVRLKGILNLSEKKNILSKKGYKKTKALGTGCSF
jgi:penicillin-binding protein 2